MFGKVHLFAAAIVFAAAGSTAASAGVIDGTHWGPVHWSCGSGCGPMPTIFYGPAVRPIYYPPQRVYRVNQGPEYLPPLLSYGEPPVTPAPDPRLYPYVYPYGGYTFSGGYRHHRFVGHRQVARMPMVRRSGRWHN
jgi:hypothetical protein